jgi:hypothetical protein
MLETKERTLADVIDDFVEIAFFVLAVLLCAGLFTGLVVGQTPAAESRRAAESRPAAEFFLDSYVESTLAHYADLNARCAVASSSVLRYVTTARAEVDDLRKKANRWLGLDADRYAQELAAAKLISDDANAMIEVVDHRGLCEDIERMTTEIAKIDKDQLIAVVKRIGTNVGGDFYALGSRECVYHYRGEVLRLYSVSTAAVIFYCGDAPLAACEFSASSVDAFGDQVPHPSKAPMKRIAPIARGENFFYGIHHVCETDAAKIPAGEPAVLFLVRRVGEEKFGRMTPKHLRSVAQPTKRTP